MSFRLNRTEQYHRHEMETLGWELTVCNTLEPERSPARRLLRHPNTFGNLLLDFLSPMLPHGHDRGRVLEVGGGYGYLMRDFLRRYPQWEGTMLELSPVMLQKQEEALSPFHVRFLTEDFFEKEPRFFSDFHAVLLNEVMGDFPTACEVPTTFDEEGLDSELAELRAWLKRFRLEGPLHGNFNVNIGAIRALDTLCSAGVPFIYLSEHSCEAQAPREWLPWLNPHSTGTPEPIPLKGHVEYTVKFSHLEQVGHQHGYRIKRGCYADFLHIDASAEVLYILTSASAEDDHEVIRHFAGDLFKYEYLVLTKT